MKSLTPLAGISVPAPQRDETYSTRVADREISFTGLKHLLGAADYSKAGDRNAGLAAANDCEREAARLLLAHLPLQHLYDHPLTDDAGRVDSVMRVNYDVDRPAFARIATMTVGQLKNHLLQAAPAEVSGIGSALTGVMAAAVAKLCDVHELVAIARKISRSTKARTLLGAPHTLSSRLQPNHPTDDLRGITLLCYLGLSLGSGDALIGVNPAVDTIDNATVILKHLDALRKQTGAPTQICVLAHIKTQLACLERSAPVEILFQSLGGTDATNLQEFDISVELLDHGYQTMAQRGALRDVARQFMYFETGQGSEFTYGKHHGIDMATAEALCYGLARRYDPFMVNNVTGFIGPETHLDSIEMVLANLQDHFMGKLLGLPMGMAPCYTLHSNIELEGQQMATELLTAAGANYYMDVCLNADRMLAYFNSPDLGAQLSPASKHGLAPEPHAVQILVSDGLSAEAVHANVPELLPVLLDGLQGQGISCGQPLVARYGRVKLAEAVADALQADLVVHLLGERPGGDALSSRSLSAYLVYRLSDPAVQAAAAKFSGNASIRFEVSVLSNIYAGGLPPLEAAGVLVERIGQILSYQAAGNRLESLLRE